MNNLGTLFWYKVGEPQITVDELRAHAEELKMHGDGLPGQILPVDVFRRQTGPKGLDAGYTLDPQRSVKLTLRPADRQTPGMIARVILRTIYTEGKATDRVTVGDYVFYHGTRTGGKARIRVTPRDISNLPDQAKIERFVQAIRDDYDESLSRLDAQGVRRLVRAHLSASHALLIDDVYFVPDVRDAATLGDLLKRVGGGSRAHLILVRYDPGHVVWLGRSLAAAHSQGRVSEDMLDVYSRIVPMAVHQIKKEEDPHDGSGHDPDRPVARAPGAAADASRRG